MKIFLIEASLIFSMAKRIFSALAFAAASSGLDGCTVAVLGQATTDLTELLMVMVDFDFSPLESLLELLEMLSQNAESLSGLSVRFTGGIAILVSIIICGKCCKTFWL